MATDHNFIVKNGLEVGGILVVNSSGELVVSTVNSNLKFQDNVKALFGSGSDFQIKHDGFHTYLTNTNGHVYFQQTADDMDIVFQNDDSSGGVTEYFRVDGSDALTNFSKHTRHNDAIRSYYGNSNDAEITHTGAQFVIQGFNGDMKMINYHDDGDIIFGSDDGSGGTATYFALDGANGYISVAKNFLLQDNVRADFGNGSDLRIVHNATNSFITNHTGDLKLIQYADDGDISFQSDDGSGGTAEYFRLDGGITKTVFEKDSKHQDGIKALFGTNDDLIIQHTGSAGYVANYTGTLSIQNNTDDGDVVIQSDNGSGSVATYFMADGSSGSANLYHYGTLKLSTQSWGVDITGELQSDSLDVDGSSHFDGAITVSNGTGTNTIVNLNGSATTYLEKDTGTDFYVANNVQDRDIFLRINAGGNTLAAQQIDASEGGTSYFKNTNAAAEIAKFGSSTQTNYTNVKFDTNTLTDHAYLIAYGDGNAKDKQFAMKNTNTAGKIFFQVGTLEPLTLTTTGAEFRGNTFSMQATGSVRLNLNADTDNAGTENDDAEISFTQDGSHNMLHLGGNGTAATPNHTGLLDNSAYIMSGNGHSGTVPLQFGNNGTANMILKGGDLGIGTTTPTTRLHLTESIAAEKSFITLENGDASTGDISNNKSFIDFAFRDSNTNEYPQVRIGAEAGPNSDADDLYKEGQGAFVVYTNNATTDGSISTSPSGMAERMRVDYRGYVGVGTTAPTNLFTVNGGAESIGVNLSNVQRLTIGSDGSWNYFKGKSGNGHKFTTTGGGDLNLSNTGILTLSTGTSNRTVQLQDDGLYISRTTDGAYTSQIIADTNNGNDLAIKVRSDLKIYHDSSHKYSFTSTGFGVNKTTPDFALCLSHNQDNAGLNSGVMLSFDPSTATDPSGYRFKSQVSGGSTGYYQVLYDGAEIAWKNFESSAYTPRMRLSNAGNLALGTTISSTVRLYVKGSTTDNSAEALLVEDSSGNNLLRVRNDGVVLIEDNYLYVSASSGAYFDNSIKARGGINNDQGDLTLSDNVNVTGQLQVYNGSSTNRIRLYTETGTAQIADTLSDTTTQKSYIYFDAGTGSNDPGYIMHETSDSEQNEGILHLVPTDDNSTNDYVSIHGTNDADCIRLHTSGLIETGNNHQLTLKSGSGDVNLNDNVTVGYNLTVTGDLVVNGSTTTFNTATLDVEDKNITLNYGSGDTSATANGAGITIQDAVNSTTDATILWDATNDEFDISHPVKIAGSIGVTNIVTNKVVKFNGSVLDDSNITDTGSAITLGSNTSVNGTLSTGAATTLHEKGFAVSDAYYAWKRSYTVSNSSTKEILDRDGNSLDTAGVYRLTAHISGTGTDNNTTAVVWNQNGTWRINVTGQSGTSSNHPEFIIDGTANKPYIRFDHTSTYTVIVYHEWMRLNEESTGTDNSGYAFGADGYLSSVNDVLRYNPLGSTSTGVDSYTDGNVIWHAGNDGPSSGLNADLLDGQHGSYYAPIAGPAFTGNSSFAGNLGIGITSPVARLDVKGEGNGPTVYDYLYATSDGIRVYGEEAGIDLVGTDSGDHSASLLLRNTNDGFSIFNDPNDDMLRVRSFTATADDFHVHSTGQSVSNLVDILALSKTGNVGIGNIAPSAKLEVQGTSTSSTYTGTGPSGTVIRAQANSGIPWIVSELNGATAYFAPESSTTAKFAAYNYATSTEMNIQLGQNRMYIQNNGRVGIGTSSLTNKFHVSGDARIEGSLMAGGAAASNVPARPIHVKSSGDAAAIRIEDTTSSNKAFDIRSTYGNGLLFVDVTASTIPMVISESGFVRINHNTSSWDGLGTLTVRQIADGKGIGIIDSASQNTLQLLNEGDHAKLYYNVNNSIIFQHVGGERMRIKGDGNVGIGQTDPTFKLHVTSADASDDVAYIHHDNASQASGTVLKTRSDAGDSNGYTLLDVQNNTGNALYVGGDRKVLVGGGAVTQGTAEQIPNKNFEVRWDSSDTTVSTGNALGGGGVGSGVLLKNTSSTSGTYTNLDFRSHNADGRIAYTYNGSDNNGDFHFITDNLNSIESQMVIKNDGKVGIATINPAYTLEVNGSFAATTKSFDIEHPTKEGMRLHHGVLEGPEHAVYIRGRTKGSIIQLPEYWTGLVHDDTITVQLTPIGKSSELYVKDISDNKVLVSNDTEYFYFIQAERKDIERFEVEYGDSI